MTTTALAPSPVDGGITAVERVVAMGDLSKLSTEDRIRYYSETCRSLGLNPLTKPFEYLQLNGKLVLYATRGATDQLRKLHGVSIAIVDRQHLGDIYVVTARATTPDGRQDEEVGAICIGALKGDALANGLMKASTKAKRRVTLSIVGLGWLDESEIETIPNARPVNPDEPSASPPAPPLRQFARSQQPASQTPVVTRHYKADDYPELLETFRHEAGHDSESAQQAEDADIKLLIDRIGDARDQEQLNEVARDVKASGDIYSRRGLAIIRTVAKERRKALGLEPGF